MTNPYGSPDAAGGQPTQPFWVGPGPAASEAPGFGEHLKRDRRTARHWTLGLIAAALLAGGGILAGLSLAGHSSPAAGQGLASPADAQQAALLNSALNRAGSPGALTTALGATAWGGASASGGTQAGVAGQGAPGALCARARGAASAAGQAGLPRLARRIALGAARCRIFRHRVFTFFLLRGVHGQFTIQTGQGTKTLAYERGVIQTVNAGKSLVVEATDGPAWTWNLVSTTVVRDRQGMASESDLAAGTPVWVGGPVVQGTKDARLIVLRPPLPAAASSSSTPGN